MAYKIEILMSTMYKTDLTFLEVIFKNNKHFSNYNILIVNQTDSDKLLVSEYKNIKVINSFERGSPASRNLAISKATGDICLMADDDIVYMPDFIEHIKNAYINNASADMISLEAIDDDGKLYANYTSVKTHNKESLKAIYTWVITFKREVFAKHNIYFNHYFGVGSVFKGETEYVFLRNALDKKLKMYHQKQTIVSHPNHSSGRLMGSDNAVYARSALHYRFYGGLSYIWVFKYVFHIWRYGHINFFQITKKLKVGFEGILKYKDLKKTGEIDKIYVS